MVLGYILCFISISFIKTDYVCKLNGKNYTSISEAAEESPEAGVIVLTKDLIKEKEIKIEKKKICIEIDESLKSCTIQKEGNESLFSITEGTLTIDDRRLTIDGEESTSGSIMTLSKSELNLKGLIITNSKETSILARDQSSLTLDDMKIMNTQSYLSNGGAIVLEESSLTMTNSRIFNNTARRGGGIYMKNVGPIINYLKLNSVKFFNNSAKDKRDNEGGGLFIDNYIGEGARENGKEVIKIEECVFRNNFAQGGGGIYLFYINKNPMSALNITIESTTFDENKGGEMHAYAAENINLKVNDYSILESNEIQPSFYLFTSKSKTVLNSIQDKSIKNKYEFLISKIGDVQINDPHIKGISFAQPGELTAVEVKEEGVKKIKIVPTKKEGDEKLELIGLDLDKIAIRSKVKCKVKCSFTNESYVYYTDYKSTLKLSNVFKLSPIPKNQFYSWDINGEKVHNQTDYSIENISKDIEATLSILNYTLITIIYPDKKEKTEYFYEERNKINLPSLEQKYNSIFFSFKGWKVNGKVCKEKEVVEIVGSTEIKPQFSIRTGALFFIIFAIVFVLFVACLVYRRQRRKRQAEITSTKKEIPMAEESVSEYHKI